jgi:hypothetical protein
VKILLDENLPRKLVAALREVDLKQFQHGDDRP